jgi:hypothetical protein
VFELLSRFRLFFGRHPLLRDVLLWSIPALLVGGALRCALLSYHPYAYWGSDSRSYYSFARMLLGEGAISLDEKRRYIYPLLMVPVSLLPGVPLRSLAWLQHCMGLLGVLPLAYIARRTFHAWRWWVVPLTVAYVGVPLFLWYEHELLAEAFFFSTFLWAFAGWVAWTGQEEPARARRLFWLFFAALAAFLLTKPSARFVVPGVVLGLVSVRAWRVLGWRQGVALGLLAGATLTVGSKKQAAWLLYVACFPLTQFDTPQHSEYKAELRAYAKPYAHGIDAYYANDGGMFKFLESPSEEQGPPLLSSLDRDPQLKQRIYMDLALEAVRARPLDFLHLGAQRLIASCNLGDFRSDRFESGYFPGKLERLLREAGEGRGKRRSASIPMAFGFDAGAPIPELEQLRSRIAPAPGGVAERFVLGWVRRAERLAKVLILPAPPKGALPAEYNVFRSRLTPLGLWLCLSIALSVFYWRTFGIWLVCGFCYLAGVFLVSLVSIRYFAPAWLVFLPVLFIPLDMGVRIFRAKTTNIRR